MKKPLFLFLFILSSVLIGCHKSTPENDGPDKYDYEYELTDFFGTYYGSHFGKMANTTSIQPSII